jgi:hypothetical protein
MKRRREPKWWVGHSRNITAMIVGIANTVENVSHPDYAGEPSVDEQFRDLRATINAFETLCRQRAGSSSDGGGRHRHGVDADNHQEPNLRR